MRGLKIGALLLAVVMLVGLWAAPSALAEEKPRYGGTLRVAIAGDPPSLDMHQEQTFLVTIPFSTVYNTLVAFDPHGYPKIIGDLAKSWTISDDKMTWTFTLHQGVTFHDGSDLDVGGRQGQLGQDHLPARGRGQPAQESVSDGQEHRSPRPVHGRLPTALRLAVVPVDAGPSGELRLCQKVSRSGPQLLQTACHGQRAIQIERVRARRVPGDGAQPEVLEAGVALHGRDQVLHHQG